GSGYALGSFWARKRPVGDGMELCDILGPGSHGSTYGGSPLACATALATVGVILRDDLAANAKALGTSISDEASTWQVPALKGIRAFGCMIGLQLDTSVIEANEDFKVSGKAASIWVGQLLLDAGLLVIPAGLDVVRLLPPLNASDAEAKEALGILKKVLGSI
ncbi:MAG: aminotransferase class III-fold pyridoxal phosphate-dependent enzyme, partial [Verrucomicrobiaceae bacterium]